MSACPRCSAALPPVATFCPSCGAPLGAAPKAAAPSIAPKSSFRPKVVVRVVGRADGGPEVMVNLDRDIWTCGQQGDFPLKDDPFVAAQQARLYFSGDRLAIDDVGGGNGVFARLRQERELVVGGELRVGRQRLVLEALSPMAPASSGAVTWGSPDPGYRIRLIQVLEGGLRGSAFPLPDGDNMLGREAGDITFPQDGFVSGKHALLRVRDGRVYVSDAGSSNGTFLRLAAPTFVEPGDHFLVGRHLLRIEIQK